MANTVNSSTVWYGLAAECVHSRLTLLIARGKDQIEVVQLAGALAGTCAGFLLFNFPPVAHLTWATRAPISSGAALGR